MIAYLKSKKPTELKTNNNNDNTEVSKLEKKLKDCELLIGKSKNDIQAEMNINNQYRQQIEELNNEIKRYKGSYFRIKDAWHEIVKSFDLVPLCGVKPGQAFDSDYAEEVLYFIKNKLSQDKNQSQFCRNVISNTLNNSSINNNNSNSNNRNYNNSNNGYKNNRNNINNNRNKNNSKMYNYNNYNNSNNTNNNTNGFNNKNNNSLINNNRINNKMGLNINKNEKEIGFNTNNTNSNNNSSSEDKNSNNIKINENKDNSLEPNKKSEPKTSSYNNGINLKQEIKNENVVKKEDSSQVKNTTVKKVDNSTNKNENLIKSNIERTKGDTIKINPNKNGDGNKTLSLINKESMYIYIIIYNFK